MDVVNRIRSCLADWPKGGESECRNILISPHCNPTDASCLDVLTTAYHTLLSSTLLTWSPKHTLTTVAFVAFVQSVLNGLPSSSSNPSANSSNMALFGELLVDLVWSVDAELEEVVADAKATIASYGDHGGALKGKDIKDTPSKDKSSPLSKVVKAKQNAENDKETVTLVVKKFLTANIINPALCRERLDLSLLANVGLISDKASFDKREIRTRTGLFYKQNKFNLLREQSEGYSKLTAELTSSLGHAHSSATARPIESYDSIEARARPVWERVISLIGYFDLDPNRALDIILDVLSVNLATHFSFFIALLSFSPWSGSYKRPTVNKELILEPPAGQYKGKSLDETLLLAESHSNRRHNGSTSTSSSPRVLAQVLGFKFAYYQSPEVSETTPRNLYLTAAILIREGFITLEDLYPHVSPNGDDMEKVRKSYQADVQSRISGAKISQLAMAAPLESGNSSTKPKPATPSEPKKTAEPKENEVPSQKVGLLIALLSIGALRPAFAIMSKFPWLVDVQPEIADLMLRLMKESLSGLYESTLVTKERNPSFSLPRARYGSGGVSLPPPKRPVLTLWAPTPPSTSTTDFVFFFPDWTERVPICSSLDDLVDIIEPMMHFIGLHVSRDPLFLTKFLRLGRLHLTSTVPVDPETKKSVGEPDPDHPVRKFWFKILRLYLLPALTLIRGNAVCAVEVWNIIRQYETTARWSLYGEWKATVYKSHPELCIREVQADRESKGILRRLSHNTIDALAGTVAKLAHSNPCIFFTNAVNQIMAYDNLANVVIQALRYVTNMGFDVLVFIVLDALANPVKPRVKDDGVNTSDWLQSLASFTGMLFRRYSADLSPVLKYIVHQLHNGQTTEIVVLRELIWKMAGIEPLPSLSESQITAMAGGPALRIEAVASATRGARLDPGDVALKGPQRLGKGLLESSLALPLLIQVAQQRQACVFNAPDAHIKSLASLYDTTHGVLLQYLELLTSPSVVSPQDYATKVLPSLAELGEQYGICAPICMQIIRPVLHSTLLTAALSMQEQERLANEEAEKRLKAALTAKREPVNVSRMASPSTGASGIPNETTTGTIGAAVETKAAPLENTAAEDITMEDTTASVASLPLAESPWLPELAALFDDIKKVAPENAFDVVGPGFYVTFWQLSMYDLTPPASKYDEEGAALRTLSRQEDSKYIAADRSADRTKRLTASSHRTRRDRYNAYVNTLAQEFKEQTVSRAFTMKRLAREKQHWFSHSPKGNALASAIIEHCIQPRCLLSPMDADYCAQIIKVIHTQGTPGFPTLLCYNKLLGDHVKVVMFSCSEYEARNYGRFLFGILTDLLKWQQDEQLFIQDNRTKVGGKAILHPGLQVRWQNKSNITTEDLIKWVDYKSLIRKWHRRLGKCFTDCIQTGEFMHVYNAIIVLKEILPVFPLASVGDVGASLDVTINEFLETEERGDLKILGRAYAASLKKRETLWAMPKSVKPNGTAASPRPTSPATAASGDRNRSTGLPSGPGSQLSADGRRAPAVLAPSAPRAHAGASQAVADKSSGVNSTKLAMESIPRPEVVKRIRPEMKSTESPKPAGDAKATKSDVMDIDTLITIERKQESAPSRTDEFRFLSKDGNSTTGRVSNLPTSRTNSPAIGPDPPLTGRKDLSQIKDLSRPPTPSQGTASAPFSTHGKELPQSPRNHRSLEEKAPRAEHVMPPPSVPSQTLSAQELRETAKQIITLRPSDRSEEKAARSTNEPRSQNGSAAPSPSARRRSTSPPTRPGTRNASADSRTSGGRPRSDRGSGDGEEKRLDRENRQDSRDHGSSTGRRESLTHIRGIRDRTSAREGDRDKDVKDGERDRDRERERGRDRHGDRTERDRERGDRERERERDRGERDRDNRERDRHRRDDKDRDRDARKERDARVGSVNASATPDERGLPTRPDLSRHRGAQNGDDGLGKRRRPTDDDPDSRVSKRSSRKDSHREDRSRRASDKEGHERTRDSDRRRKDRDGENPSSERSGDKRIPEGPLSSVKVLPSSTPSAPRAMSTGEAPRGGKTDVATGRDREWKSQRDQPSNASQAGPSGGSSTTQQEALSHAPGSLRSRIGDKETHSRSLPQAPHNSYRPDPSSKDDDRDGSRKRTLSDREKDIAEPASGVGSEQAAQVPKRPRINRNRYAIAQKLLPIDPQVGDRKRSGRSD